LGKRRSRFINPHFKATRLRVIDIQKSVIGIDILKSIQVDRY
jgi:hypothetical protein